MQQILGSATTRDGAAVTVRRVRNPDPAWAEKISPFLSHKDSIWRWQTAELLKSCLGELEFYCYVADLNAGADDPASADLAATICTIERAGAGIFCHVFTRPEHRGRSLARILTDWTLRDFAARGGLALWLVTGFNSTAFRVYSQYGFVPMSERDGRMAWVRDPAGLAARYAPGQACSVRAADWPDYPALNTLACLDEGPPMRSFLMTVVGPDLIEYDFLALKQAMRGDVRTRANVLAAGDDWPVGWAICQPADGRWTPRRLPGLPLLFDLYAHPAFEAEYPRLIGSMDLPADVKVLSLIDSHCPARREALERFGFVEEGTLTGMFPWRGRPTDLIWMARNPQ